MVILRTNQDICYFSHVLCWYIFLLIQNIRLKLGVALKLTHVISDKIAAHIKAENMLPGDTLPPESEMCATYEVSRTVIREALTLLSAVGIIKTGNGRKPCVANVNPDILTKLVIHALSIKDINTAQVMEARRSLEIESVRLASLRRSEQDLVRIETTLTEMKASINEHEKFIELDLRFHLDIAAASQNPVFIYLITALRKPISSGITIAFNQTGPDQKRLKRILKEHEVIARLIRKKSSDKAVNAMQEHLDQSYAAQNTWAI